MYLAKIKHVGDINYFADISAVTAAASIKYDTTYICHDHVPI